MNYWLENSVRNLLPLSKSESFSEALGEWFFTGSVEDYNMDEADVQCELCEHPDLAHHYEIRNSFTQHALLVGSSCILKFSQIEIRDAEGRAVTDRNERELELRRALRQKVIESALGPLRILWRQDTRSRKRIKYLADTLKDEAGISPDDLIFLLESMDQRGIPYSVKTYKLSLRSDYEKSQISRLSDKLLNKIKPALSNEQLKRLYRSGKNF